MEKGVHRDMEPFCSSFSIVSLLNLIGLVYNQQCISLTLNHNLFKCLFYSALGHNLEKE